jgi:hypothetical protein
VALPGTVVPHDESAAGVGVSLQDEVGEKQIPEPLRHVVGHGIGPDKFAGFVGLVALAQLDDRFNGVELDKVGITHAVKWGRNVRKEK